MNHSSGWPPITPTAAPTPNLQRELVTDALNLGRAGRLPWTELARRVQALEGIVALQWRIARDG